MRVLPPVVHTEVNAKAGELATIEHAIMDNGRSLARLLLRAMVGENVENLQSLQPHTFIPRASLGPPRTTP